MEFVSKLDTYESHASAPWLHEQLIEMTRAYGHVYVGNYWQNSTLNYNVSPPLCIDVDCTLMNPAPGNRYWFRSAPDDSGWAWESRSYSTWRSAKPHVVEESGFCHTEIEVLAHFETFLAWRILPADRPHVLGSNFSHGLDLALVSKLLAKVGMDLPHAEALTKASANETREGDDDDVRSIITRVTSCQPGRAAAHEYQREVAEVMAKIFAPHLVDFTIEQEIDRGTKRVDVIAVNAAKAGFFDWVRANYPPVPYVHIECKNVTVDPTNPELDQLLGRFSVHRGNLGFLVCRTVLDMERLMIRCREAFKNGQGMVIPITDADLLTLAAESGDRGEFPLLRSRFRILAM